MSAVRNEYNKDLASFHQPLSSTNTSMLSNLHKHQKHLSNSVVLPEETFVSLESSQGF